MGFSNSRREKQVNKHQEDIERVAKDTVTVTDFNDHLYIAFDGTPLILIEDSWTPKDIVDKLDTLRQNYISSRMESYEPKFMDLLFG